MQGPSPQQAQQQQQPPAGAAAPSGSRPAAPGSNAGRSAAQQLYGQQPVDESVLAELPPELQREIRAQMKAEEMAARFNQPKPAGGTSAAGSAGSKRPASKGGAGAPAGTQRIDAFLKGKRPKK